MTRRYLQWIGTRAFLGHTPTSRFDKDIRFGGFETFSQYWLNHRGLDDEDLQMLSSVVASSTDKAIAVDVGANIGLFSLAMSKAGFAEVHAFEPIPETFQTLLSNLKMNLELSRRVIPNQLGIGATRSELEFSNDRRSPGQNRIALGNKDHDQVVPSCVCQVSTLDAYFEEMDLKDALLIKIDVEGFETDVLRGGLNILRSGRVRFIYLEIIAKALEQAGSSAAELNDLLRQARFSPVELSGDGGSPFTPVSFETAVLRAGNRRNVLYQRQGLS